MIRWNMEIQEKIINAKLEEYRSCLKLLDKLAEQGAPVAELKTWCNAEIDRLNKEYDALFEQACAWADIICDATAAAFEAY